MRRKVLLLAVLAVVALAPQASAEALTQELMPGVTYTRETRTVGGKRVVLHVVEAPQPGGLYRLVPVLGGGTLTGRETLTSMQQRLAAEATVVGVNGDYYNVDLGFPSGIVMRDGALHGRPNPSRASLGIGLDGILRLDRIEFSGSWAIGTGEGGVLAHVNRPLAGAGTVLFTPVWGAETPRRRNAVDVVLAGLPATAPGVDLAAQVVEVRRGGRTPIPAGGAVLQALGAPGRDLQALAQPGSPVVVRLTLEPSWDGIADAIGGGPALIRDGRVVFPTEEQFSSAQLRPRHPRTAVGQLANGRVVLVAVDGRSSTSAGIGLKALAFELLRLGAVTAMAFDGGGGTTMAFDARLLNRPSDGSERAVSNALMLLYEGAYVPAPAHAVVSPNGDGVAETQSLSFKLVQPSQVTVRLLGPGGDPVVREQGPREAGSYPLDLPPAELREGRWRLVVTAVDELGRKSTSERAFRVDNTLGFLELSKERVKLGRRGGRLGISFSTAHRARLVVTVEDRLGRVVRTLLSRRRQAKGPYELLWNGRNDRGRVVGNGAYTVRVLARGPFGPVELTRPVAVRRTG